ncbi:Z-ring-associated protein ZapA [hydrothermal vent metagenome]|uniref:Cell division protein ZapA n=1 Tax=hydrothermal vent metagenome TaxID=652676 RepID=A0A3B0YFV3_9ZZZZ
MNDHDIIPVTVNILDREYRITCPAGEEQALQAAARHLNERMQDVKSSGKVVGVDRIAVMVALNITHEFLAIKPGNDHPFDNISDRLKSIQEKIELALDYTTH